MPTAQWFDAEIDANHQKARIDLAQSIAKGIEAFARITSTAPRGRLAVVIWPVWFGMDFKGAAGKDAANLQVTAKNT